MPSVRACRNSGMTRASSGTIWATRIATRIWRRSGNAKRATATAASSATSEETVTVTIATSAEFSR